MQTALQILIQFRYFLIVPVTLVEGPVVMMVSGLLIKLGYLSFVPAYLLLMLGDLLGDIIWYGVGHAYGHRFIKRFGKYFSVTEEGVETMKRVFHRHHAKILFISKITMGLGFALVTLMAAGMSKIPFRRYLLLNFAGQFIWTGVLVSVGYLFGNFYVTLDSILGKIFLAAAFIMFFLCLIGFGKYMKKQTAQRYSS